MSECVYRVGVIGCGGISRAHARAYMNNGRTQIVAAADINVDAVRKFSEEFNVPAQYNSYERMLEQEELDIVSVCTWQGTHAEITLKAAESGVKGILCEKPMAVNYGQAEAMVEACEANGVRLVIGHQRRFDPVNVTARKLILAGTIGEPTMAFRRASGGLLNWGTHLIDNILYLLDDRPAKWVIGQVGRKTDRYERRVRIEDFASLSICFDGGVRGFVETDVPGPSPSAALMYGTDGILTHQDGKIVVISRSGVTEVQPKGDGTNQLQELIDWIEGRVDVHRGAGVKAKATMEIMMAAYESVRIKDIVKLPLQTKESPLEMMIEDGTLPVEKPGRYDIRVPFDDQK